MYCGRCGKRVLDDMLFCPFCGAPIVIPDQDAPSAPAEMPPEPEPADEPQACDMPLPPTESLFGEEEPPEEPEPAAEEEPFVPLLFSFDEPEEEHAPEAVPEPPQEAPENRKEAPESRQSAPEIRQAAQKIGNRPPRSRNANTYVPVRDLDPEDLFMDSSDEDAYDSEDYDSDEFESDGFEAGDSFDFEEKEEGGFFRRHVRGVVALVLLAVVLLICAIWSFTDGGQLTLAKLNVAWTAQPYAQLGYEAYGAEDYTLSAKYYSRAIALEQDNYEYAHSAMVAEYMADDIDAATVMAKKCIELNPDSAEPYTELKKIYTNRELPWDVKELLKQGYERTGDESLNVK